MSNMKQTISLISERSNKMIVEMTISVAAHPQVRRKLDDVAHKLNILYDKLRAQTLSPA